MGHLKTAPPHPSQCAHWDSPPLLAPFGRHFPLTGGISLPPGEGILTPNPPAQNRRPVINVICNSTHVTIPDINITWESNPTHGSVTPAFCAAKKSIFNFQPQSRAAPCISPAAPSEIKWTARPGGRAPQRGSKASGAAGASPRPTENYPSKSGRPHGAAPTGLICLVLLGTFQRKGLRAAKDRPYREGKILWGGRVRTPAPTRMQGRSRSPPRGRSQTGLRKTAPGRWFGKLRRRSGTAIAVIFRLLRPPVGPDGMAPKHTWSCAPEGLCPL